MTQTVDISKIVHDQFPSLNQEHNGKKLVFMDGPGGTQVPASVIEAISNYYLHSNANTHGFFPTAQETDIVLKEARMSMSDFLGAEGPQTISFGQNMTSLNFSLSKAVLRTLQPGDEILITQLDHEANRGPWLNLREYGILVREVNLLPQGILDYQDFENKINENTRLVAMGCASNALGTVNDIMRAREITHHYGAWLALDAVHFAPHFPIDVQSMGCDFLFCSAYKFYGPHVGVLYSKPGVLDRLTTDCLRTQDQMAPYKIETGTLNHAALNGVAAAVDFLASLGEGEGRRSQLENAMNRLSIFENKLGKSLYEGLKSIDGIQVKGPDFSTGLRAPTVSIAIDGSSPEELCRFLADDGICAWDGHFYAVRAIEVLGLLEKGGVTRFGISAYTSEKDVARVIEKVTEFMTVRS